MAFCALSFLCASPADNGPWGRILWSEKGFERDLPPPEPLSYFTATPFLRDDGNELCAPCTPEGRAQSAQKYSIRTEIKPVGVLAGYRILDLLYYVGSREHPEQSAVKWKSILVEVGPDQYREIFHLQAFYTTASISTSRIIQSGDERVLASVDSDGGNGGGCWEGYWWFDPAGAYHLDFSLLRAAIQEKVPANSTFGVTCSSLDLKSQRVRSTVQDSRAQCHACGSIGEVTARFRLDGSIVKPAAVTFSPSGR